MTELKITFPDEKSRNQFFDWFFESSGEQEFWNYQEISREQAGTEPLYGKIEEVPFLDFKYINNSEIHTSYFEEEE